MKFIWITMFFLSFLSPISAKEVDYTKIVHKITSQFVRSKAKEKDLFLIGSGGAMMDDVKKINLYFTAYHSSNIEDARRLYVEIVESYLKLVNANQKLRPHLHNYPFDYHNLYLSIGFEDQNHRWQKDGIAHISHKPETGIISYSVYDLETKRLINIFQEHYEEALKIVKGLEILNSSQEVVENQRLLRDELK